MGSSIQFGLISWSPDPQYKVHHAGGSDTRDTRWDTILSLNPWSTWCDGKHGTDTLWIACATCVNLTTRNTDLLTNNIPRTNIPTWRTRLTMEIAQEIAFAHTLALTRHQKTQPNRRWRLYKSSNIGTVWHQHRWGHVRGVIWNSHGVTTHTSTTSPVSLSPTMEPQPHSNPHSHY